AGRATALGRRSGSLSPPSPSGSISRPLASYGPVLLGFAVGRPALAGGGPLRPGRPHAQPASRRAGADRRYWTDRSERAVRARCLPLASATPGAEGRFARFGGQLFVGGDFVGRATRDLGKTAS